MNRHITTVLLLAALPGLSGCIAAALPVVAGGAMVAKGKMSPGSGANREGRHQARVVAPAATASPTVVTPVAASGEAVVLTPLKELPPPSGAMTSAESGVLRKLTDYAEAEAKADPAKAKSALLATPGALDATRAPCRSSERAVFIDLDPGRGTFDPLMHGTPQPGLAATLAELRAQGIAVVWFSRLGENFAGALRSALADSGLDRDRRDQVVLMRTIEERKQTRREALADFLCPVALVGDEKADFDELYLYLKKPDSALALDGMIGQGWFVVSPFLAPTKPTSQSEVTTP